MSNIPFIFFGTPYVARDTLAALVAAGYVPTLVVTSPDAPQGRGMTLTPCVTKVWALEHGIPVLTPEVLDATLLQTISESGAAYGIAVAYGKIIPEAVIHAFPKGILNVHYSLLPKYRGASPVEAALLQGESETGVTIQQMVFRLDAGDVLAQEVLPISPAETIQELRPRLIDAGSSLLIETLPSFIEGSIAPVPQDDSLATRAPKIRKEEGLLSIAGDAYLNWSKYRAYKESPGTYFFAAKGEQKLRCKIKEAHYTDGVFVVTTILPEGKTEQPFSYLAQNGWAPE